MRNRRAAVMTGVPPPVPPPHDDFRGILRRGVRPGRGALLVMCGVGAAMCFPRRSMTLLVNIWPNYTTMAPNPHDSNGCLFKAPASVEGSPPSSPIPRRAQKAPPPCLPRKEHPFPLLSGPFPWPRQPSAGPLAFLWCALACSRK